MRRRRERCVLHIPRFTFLHPVNFALGCRILQTILQDYLKGWLPNQLVLSRILSTIGQSSLECLLDVLLSLAERSSSYRSEEALLCPSMGVSVSVRSVAQKVREAGELLAEHSGFFVLSKACTLERTKEFSTRLVWYPPNLIRYITWHILFASEEATLFASKISKINAPRKAKPRSRQCVYVWREEAFPVRWRQSMRCLCVS